MSICPICDDDNCQTHCQLTESGLHRLPEDSAGINLYDAHDNDEYFTLELYCSICRKTGEVKIPYSSVVWGE